MILTQALLLGISFSLLAVLAAYKVAKTRFFQEPLEFLASYSSEPVTKDKRSMRKLKKIKTRLERAKKRLMLLFFIHLSIFVLSYTALVTLVYILVPTDMMLVKIPVGIPLLSYPSEEGDYYITHIVFIAFIGFMAPSYLFARLIKSTQPQR